MDVLFEMIPSTVRDDTGIKDMDLPDRPAVKSGLWEKFLKQIMTANLDVAAPYTQSSDPRSCRYCALVPVVQDPAYRCDVSIDSGNLHKLKLSELVIHCIGDLEPVLVRPADRLRFG